VGADHEEGRTARVRAAELRAQGLSPKEIARRLGLRPAEVATLVRAEAGAAATARGERPDAPGEVTGAWASAGWSARLGRRGAAARWPDAPGAHGSEGLVSVLVERRHRYGKAAVCGYLVDVYCLGVKDALGPRVLEPSEVPAYRQRYFASRRDPPVAVPFAAAQHLVLGAVEYARGLGFEPAPDFAAARAHLGTLDERPLLTFGRDGRPSYVQGPNDDHARVVATLERTVGRGGFDVTIVRP